MNLLIKTSFSKFINLNTIIKGLKRIPCSRNNNSIINILFPFITTFKTIIAFKYRYYIWLSTN